MLISNRGPRFFVTSTIFVSGLLILFLFSRESVSSYKGWYGSVLCEDRDHYNCVTVGKKVVEKEVSTKSGSKTVRRAVDPEWEDVWPDPAQREIIMKVNRMNIDLKAGYRLAVPKNLAGQKLIYLSPFDQKIDPPGEKLLIFDPAILAFAAYDKDGVLVRWGPAVGGRGGYQTPAGEFRINSKGDKNCRSRIYPEGCEGRACSPMPFCMEFRHGAAFHAGDLPGRHESHGCVRLFYDDAEWLSKEFVELGTRVIVKPYR